MNNEKLDNLIRDVTSQYPMAKSEARRRINELIQDALKEFAEEVKLKKSKLPEVLDTPWGKTESQGNIHFNEGYNRAIKDQSQLITNALNKLKE